VAHWERIARLFLAERTEPLENALQRLSAAEVTGFVVAQCGPGGRSGASAKILTSGLRSLLRYLHLAGRVPIALAQAVPRAAGWRLSSLPRALEAEQVQRLLSSCDRSTVVGRRDLAILLLLARLGLRACEVARLCLDDIDIREDRPGGAQSPSSAPASRSATVLPAAGWGGLAAGASARGRARVRRP